MLSSTSAVYGDYLKAGNAYWTGPILVLCMFAMQCSSIMNSYTLVWWQAKCAAMAGFLLTLILMLMSLPQYMAPT